MSYNANDDRRTTLEKSADWVRDLENEQPLPKQRPTNRTWSYYLAIILAIFMLLCVATGMGSVILIKGREIFQRYIERLYGL